MKLKLFFKLLFAIVILNCIGYAFNIISINTMYMICWLVMVIFFVTIIITIVNYIKIRYNNHNTGTNRGIDPVVHYYKSIGSFVRAASNTSIGEIGGIYMAPMDRRVYGGVAYLTAEILNGRKLMRQKSYARDYDVRSNTIVPGYLDVTGEYIEYNHQLHYMWHRTHILPFNFVLSEGDNIEGLMFAGTAHLNHGDRPQLHYSVSDNRDRINALFDLWRNYKGGKNHLEMTSLSRIRVPNTPNGTHYSMDDIEQLASRIIKYVGNKQTPFKYSVRCLYGDDIVIPTAVEIRLYNLSTNKLVLHVRLPNAL